MRTDCQRIVVILCSRSSDIHVLALEGGPPVLPQSKHLQNILPFIFICKINQILPMSIPPFSQYWRKLKIHLGQVGSPDISTETEPDISSGYHKLNLLLRNVRER